MGDRPSLRGPLVISEGKRRSSRGFGKGKDPKIDAQLTSRNVQEAHVTAA